MERRAFTKNTKHKTDGQIKASLYALHVESTPSNIQVQQSSCLLLQYTTGSHAEGKHCRNTRTTRILTYSEIISFDSHRIQNRAKPRRPSHVSFCFLMIEVRYLIKIMVRAACISNTSIAGIIVCVVGCRA